MKDRNRIKAEDEFRELFAIFETVIDALNEIRDLPLLTAFQIDDELPRQRVYNALGVEYLADLHRTTRKALSRGSELQPSLWNAFCALVEGEHVPPALARNVITRCGRLYRDRRLSPNLYFRPWRNGSALSHGRAA